MLRPFWSSAAYSLAAAAAACALLTKARADWGVLFCALSTGYVYDPPMHYSQRGAEQHSDHTSALKGACATTSSRMEALLC